MIAALLLAAGAATAQDDPTVMTINGQPVARSEFEYSYNKNNAEGVIDKKTVEQYVDLFVNYKLKVAAALEAKLDTLTSFKQEFAQYRDQQIRPSFVTDSDVEAEARKVYDNTKLAIGPRGLVRPAHIFLYLGQQATPEQQQQAKERIDSIYGALKAGADFADMARRLSQDRGSAANGGLLPWIGPNQTLKEFEDKAYALKDGEMSEPFLSPAGYHIILMKGHKQLEPYDSLRSNILGFLEQRNVRERIARMRIDTIVAHSHGTLTREEVLARRADSLMARTEREEEFRRRYEEKEKFNITNTNVTLSELGNVMFVSPMSGTVVRPFSLQTDHKGTDLAVKPKSNILATLGGTVIFCGYTAEHGYTVVMQHSMNTTSVYAGCGTILKNEGDIVEAGEAIALTAGTNSGEKDSVIMHFELWHNGKAVNPENFILF